MKNAIKLCYLFFAATFILFSCTKNESITENDILSETAKINLERTFYNSTTNLISPDLTNLKFSVSPLRTNEIEYLFNEVIKKTFLKQNIEIGFINGVAIYHKDNGTGVIKDEDIFALSIYDIRNENQMMHRFYIKEDGVFVLKKDLKETFINTENQNFLVWKYKNKDYEREGVTVSRLINIDDDNFIERRSTTRNEFNLLRVRNMYPKVDNSLSRNTELEYVEVGLGDCFSGCSETGIGTCSGGYYCAIGGECPICEDCNSRETAISQSLVSETVANSLFDLDLHRKLRDDFLSDYSLGQKHIDYYYAISEFVLISDYNTSTFLQMIETLPSFNQSVNKLLDDNTSGSEVLLSQQLNDDMKSILNDFKMMSTNLDFQYILNDLDDDIDIMTNKSKDDLILSFE